MIHLIFGVLSAILMISSFWVAKKFYSLEMKATGIAWIVAGCGWMLASLAYLAYFAQG